MALRFSDCVFGERCQELNCGVPDNFPCSTWIAEDRVADRANVFVVRSEGIGPRIEMRCATVRAGDADHPAGATHKGGG